MTLAHPRWIYVAWLVTRAAAAQSAPEFEVASIKEGLNASRALDTGRTPGVKIDPSKVDITSLTLASLILTAYKIEPYQLSGLERLPTTSWDIRAKLHDGAHLDQVPEMLQALLAERFKLVLRRETTDEQAYALVVAKDGPRLQDARVDDLGPCEDLSKGGRVPIVRYQTEHDGCRLIFKFHGRTVFQADRIAMAEMPRVLGRYVDLPVRDMTNLAGRYEVTLDVPNVGVRASLGLGRGSADLAPARDVASEPASVSIFKSIQMLGLNLEKRKIPIDHFVVVSVAKTPTEN